MSNTAQKSTTFGPVFGVESGIRSFFGECGAWRDIFWQGSSKCGGIPGDPLTRILSLPQNAFHTVPFPVLGEVKLLPSLTDSQVSIIAEEGRAMEKRAGASDERAEETADLVRRMIALTPEEKNQRIASVAGALVLVALAIFVIVKL